MIYGDKDYNSNYNSNSILRSLSTMIRIELIYNKYNLFEFEYLLIISRWIVIILYHLKESAHRKFLVTWEACS
jgi:hypothetical protein